MDFRVVERQRNISARTEESFCYLRFTFYATYMTILPPEPIPFYKSVEVV